MSIEPDGGLMILALGAAAMAAGARSPFGVMAFGAMDEDLPGLGFAALADRLYGAEMAGQKP